MESLLPSQLHIFVPVHVLSHGCALCSELCRLGAFTRHCIAQRLVEEGFKAIFNSYCQDEAFHSRRICLCCPVTSNQWPSPKHVPPWGPSFWQRLPPEIMIALATERLLRTHRIGLLTTDSLKENPAPGKMCSDAYRGCHQWTWSPLECIPQATGPLQEPLGLAVTPQPA